MRQSVRVIFALFAIVVAVNGVSAPAVAKDLKVETQAGKFIDIKEVRSPGGITAWLVEDHTVPVIAVEFGFLDAGGKQDPTDKQGLAQLASNMLDEGAGELDSQGFQGELENLSVRLRFSAGRDHFSGSFKTLSRNKARAFELLKLALTQPRFDSEPLGRMKIANQSRVKGSMTQPDWIATRIQNDRIFEGHPYGRNNGGTLSSLEAIKAEDLRGFMKRLGRNNVRVSVAGDITAGELVAVLDSVFGALPEASIPEDKPIILSNPGKTYLHVKDIPQTVIEMVQPGISRKDPDYHTAQVMNFILGSSGFGSRLTEEVREKRGLTYGIFTYLMDYEDVQAFHVSTSTVTESVGEVIGLIRAEWKKMAETDISEKELSDARSYLIGSLPLSMTSTDKIAGLMLSLQMDELPVDYLDERQKKIEKTTVADVRRVAQKLLKPELFTTVLVGKKESAQDATLVERLPNVE